MDEKHGTDRFENDLAMFDTHAAKLRTVCARLFYGKDFILRRYDSVIEWLRRVAVDADDF